MKFCKDCRYYEPFKVDGYPSLARCWNNPKFNLITGERLSSTASFQRRVISSRNHCGPEARFFEPIPESSTEPVDNKQEASHNPTFIEQVVKFFKRS